MAIKKKTLKKKAIKKRISPRRKPLKRKPAKKKVIKKKLIPKKPLIKKIKKEGNIIGVVTHYFPHVSAAVIKLKAPLSIGDTIKIKGHTTDLKQNITSMQMDHISINEGKKGQEIGLLVDSRVRQHDTVYKV